jgi:hypothetical protein
VWELAGGLVGVNRYLVLFPCLVRDKNKGGNIGKSPFPFFGSCDVRRA